MLPFHLLLKRTLRKWRLLSTLALGTLLGIGLFASGPLYTDAVIEFGLRAALRRSTPQSAHLSITTAQKVDGPGYQELDDEVRVMVSLSLGGWAEGVRSAANTQPVFPWMNGAPVADERINIRYYEGLFEQVEVTAGQLPEVTASPGEFQAVVSEAMARHYQLESGDRLALSREADAGAPEVEVLITGIVRAKAPGDAYWFGLDSPLRSQATQRWKSQYGLLVDRATLLEAAEQVTPGANVFLAWRLFIAHDRIAPGSFLEVLGALNRLEVAAQSQNVKYSLESGLGQLLAAFSGQAGAVRVPLYLLIAQVSLLILYYLLMTAALVLRLVERELSVLKSRGASGGQILRLQAAEASLLGGISLIAAPPLATSLIRRLSLLQPFSGMGELGALSTRLGPESYFWAAAGVALCLAGLLVPVAGLTKRSEVTLQQGSARPVREALWHRYYLDLFLVAAGAILFLRLREFGSLLARNLFGDLAVDPLLLLSPVLLLFGSSILLLRLIPILLRGIGWLLGRSRGVSTPLAVWQISRNPVHVSRLVLLMILAFALGLLSTGFAAALDLNQSSQARYAAGADLRLVSATAPRLASFVPAGAARTLVWRGSASLPSGRVAQVDVLGIEPATFVQLARFRSDFSEQPLGELLGMLAADTHDQLPGLEVPGEPEALGLWAYAPAHLDEQVITSDVDDVRLRARLQDASGVAFSIEFREAPNANQAAWVSRLRALPEEDREGRQEILDRLSWRAYRAGLALPDGAPTYPLRLLALDVVGRARPAVQPGVLNFNYAPAVILDSLTALEADGSERVIDGFEIATLPFWGPPGDEGTASAVGMSMQVVREGRTALKVLAQFARPGEALALVRDPLRGGPPVELLASPQFLQAVRAQVGENVEIRVDSREISARIIGVAQYFPTLYEEPERPWAVVNYARLLPILNQFAGSLQSPNELWLESEGPAPEPWLEGLMTGSQQVEIADVVVREEVEQTLKAEPFTLGLRGMFYIAYLVSVTLAIAGFAVYFYISARGRQAELSALRAIGLSQRQLLSLLGVEQLTLIFSGLAAGVALGLALSRMVMPLLTTTMGSETAVPPFVAVVDYAALMRMAGWLAGAFLLTFAGVTALLWRADILRVMKIGEE